MLGRNVSYFANYAWANAKGSLSTYAPSRAPASGSDVLDLAVFRNNAQPVQITISNATGQWEFSSSNAAPEGLWLITAATPSNASSLAPSMAPTVASAAASPAALPAPRNAVDIDSMGSLQEIDLGTAGGINATFQHTEASRGFLNLGWEPTEQPVSLATHNGSLFIYGSHVPADATPLLSSPIATFGLQESTFRVDSDAWGNVTTPFLQASMEDYPATPEGAPYRFMQIALQLRSNATGVAYDVLADPSAGAWRFELRPTAGAAPQLRYN